MRSSLCACCVVVGTLLGSVPAQAQSAGDKATARRLATEGIERYEQGKYAEALERLQRAEALYDAPVHLLYIARAQVKLQQLVEAAETYRRLVRVQLEPASPAAFRDALEAGNRELGQLEPRLGALRIDVEPAGIASVALSIDGQAVSAASLGIDRPTNPGRHVVRASAPGYSAVEETVELGEAEKKALRLELRKHPANLPTDGAAPHEAAQSRGDVTATATDPPQPPERRRGSLDLFVGLRVGAGLPGGALYKTDGGEIATQEYFKAAAVAELHAGLWFARYFGAKLFVEAATFGPGKRLERLDELRPGTRVENSPPTAAAFGLAVMAGLPLRQWGAFGELGLSVVERYSATRTFEAGAADPCGADFEQKLAFSGGAFRAAVGARIPLSEYFQLTPYVLGSFGQFGSVENESSCAELTGIEAIWPRGGDIADSEQTGHRMIVIGLGGDVLLGLN